MRDSNRQAELAEFDHYVLEKDRVALAKHVVSNGVSVRTGSTGYIGGDVLFELVQAHPEYEITCLVRNSNKGAQVASQYSKVRLVYGDLDDLEILEVEAKKVDIVLNCANADHEAGAKALLKGLAARTGDKPGFFIHTSGTGLLLYKDLERNVFGEASSKVYDDWDGIQEVTSIPDFAPHRIVDKIIIEADSSKLRTAIVCPPTIYGVGRGPSNQRGHQLYELARCTLEKKKGVQVGAGLTYWTNIHVYDMSNCYLKLVEAAARGGGKATWGDKGYYFTENGEHVWGQISKSVTSAAFEKDLIASNEVLSVTNEEANQLTRWGMALWGANSRCKAVRARKILGWLPKEHSLEDEIPTAVSGEAKRLGLTQGHAIRSIS